MNSTHYDPIKLTQLREGKMTQKQLAAVLEVTEMTVYRAEKGSSASYELLLKICGIFGVDIRDILTPEKAEKILAAN